MALGAAWGSWGLPSQGLPPVGRERLLVEEAGGGSHRDDALMEDGPASAARRGCPGGRWSWRGPRAQVEGKMPAHRPPGPSHPRDEPRAPARDTGLCSPARAGKELECGRGHLTMAWPGAHSSESALSGQLWAPGGSGSVLCPQQSALRPHSLPTSQGQPVPFGEPAPLLGGKPALRQMSPPPGRLLR